MGGRAEVAIELHTVGGVFDGAAYASFRLISEIGTYTDQYLHPTNPPNNSRLSGAFTLSKHAKAGLWSPQQIVLGDAVRQSTPGGTHTPPLPALRLLALAITRSRSAVQ